MAAMALFSLIRTRHAALSLSQVLHLATTEFGQSKTEVPNQHSSKHILCSDSLRSGSDFAKEIWFVLIARLFLAFKAIIKPEMAMGMSRDLGAKHLPKWCFKTSSMRLIHFRPPLLEYILRPI